MILLPLLALGAEAEFRVVAVERHEAPAARLVQRVQETLTLQGDGRTVRIHLGRTHRRFGTPLPFQVGERVRLLVPVRGNGRTVLRDQIVRL